MKRRKSIFQFHTALLSLAAILFGMAATTDAQARGETPATHSPTQTNAATALERLADRSTGLEYTCWLCGLFEELEVAAFGTESEDGYAISAYVVVSAAIRGLAGIIDVASIMLLTLLAMASPRAAAEYWQKIVGLAITMAAVSILLTSEGAVFTVILAGVAMGVTRAILNNHIGELEAIVEHGSAKGALDLQIEREAALICAGWEGRVEDGLNLSCSGHVGAGHRLTEAAILAGKRVRSAPANATLVRSASLDTGDDHRDPGVLDGIHPRFRLGAAAPGCAPGGVQHHRRPGHGDQRRRDGGRRSICSRQGDEPDGRGRGRVRPEGGPGAGMWRGRPHGARPAGNRRPHRRFRQAARTVSMAGLARLLSVLVPVALLSACSGWDAMPDARGFGRDNPLLVEPRSRDHYEVRQVVTPWHRDRPPGRALPPAEPPAPPTPRPAPVPLMPGTGPATDAASGTWIIDSRGARFVPVAPRSRPVAAPAAAPRPVPRPRFDKPPVDHRTSTVAAARVPTVVPDVVSDVVSDAAMEPDVVRVGAPGDGPGVGPDGLEERVPSAPAPTVVATLRFAPHSARTPSQVRQLAAVLLRTAEVVTVRGASAAGHDRLARNRAKAVRQRLAALGVAPERLVLAPPGGGADVVEVTKPAAQQVATGARAPGHAANNAGWAASGRTESHRTWGRMVDRVEIGAVAPWPQHRQSGRLQRWHMLTAKSAMRPAWPPPESGSGGFGSRIVT